MRIGDWNLLPLPALIVIIFGLLYREIFIGFLAGYTEIQEAVSLPHVLGWTLFDLFTGVNLLLAAYVLVSLVSFILDGRRGWLRRLPTGSAYALSLVLLVLYQVMVSGFEERFELPESVVKARITEFRPLDGRGLEDVLIPRSDLCGGFRDPEANRLTLTVTRPGDFIWHRRNAGRVHNARDRIHGIIQEHADLAGMAGSIERDVAGGAPFIPLISVDTECPIIHMQHLLKTLEDADLGFSTVELRCRCDMKRRFPELDVRHRYPFYYELPAGKLDLSLSVLDPPPQGALVVELIADREAKDGFRIVIGENRFEGEESLTALYRRLETFRGKASDPAVALRARKEATYGQFLAVYTECLRAGVPGLHLEVEPDLY